jgi:hypothetical protein
LAVDPHGHAAKVASCHACAASALNRRSVRRETRWRCRLNVVDRGVDAEKALGRSGRLEALHLSFLSSDRLMRILGPVVLAQILLMPG